MSSCEAGTGYGLPHVDECAGLPAALELAGVGTVVSPQWSVSVEAGAVFAELFYEQLASAEDNFDVLAAVDNARHRMRTMTGEEGAYVLSRFRAGTDDPLVALELDVSIESFLLEPTGLPFEHPYEWAAFSVSGADTVRLHYMDLPTQASAVAERHREFELPTNIPQRRGGADASSWLDVFAAADAAEQLAAASNSRELAALAAEKLCARGQAELRAGRTDEARRDFTRTAELDPTDVESRIQLAKMALDYGTDDEDVLRRCEEILKLRPGQPTAMLLGAYALMGLDRYEEARDQLDRLIAQDLDAQDLGEAIGVLANEARAQVRQQLGLIDEATADVDAAIALRPEQAELHRLRCQLNLACRHAELALQDANRAIFLAPNDAKMYSTRGLAQAVYGDPAAALEDFARALKLDPEDVDVRYDRICAWSQIHAGDDIEAELRWVLERQPRLRGHAAVDPDLAWARANLPAVFALLTQPELM